MTDASTYAPGIGYYVIGDGRMAAAIRSGGPPDGSPYGLLLIGNPDNTSRIEGTLLFHPDLGLRRSLLTVVLDGIRYTAHSDVTTRYEQEDDGLSVSVRWMAGSASVTEHFSVRSAQLIRNVHVEGGEDSRGGYLELALYANPILFREFSAVPDGVLSAKGFLSLYLASDPPGHSFERFLRVDGMNAVFAYTLEPEMPPPPLQRLSEDNPRPNPNLFSLCHNGIRSVTSESGRFNASIWQYDFEWGLDAAMAASAAVCAGDATLSRQILSNILGRLSNDQGMIAEAGRFRGGQMSELNGNGAVLDALCRYRNYSGDDEFIREHWQRIAAIASYPLLPEFSHPSGLLLTRRDFWERYPWMGVGAGFELGHQVLCAAGLQAAAELATAIGRPDQAGDWRDASETIAEATLHHPQFRLIEDGRFVRRRLTDGTVEEFLRPDGYDNADYAPFIGPSAETTPNPCEPDATEVLPVIYGLVSPHDPVMKKTLEQMESLWNPSGIGGYSRYNTASDPDSPGAWPFATAFIAAAELECGMTERALRSIEWLHRTAGSAGSWYEFYGTRREPPFPPVGIIVWGWAQYILLYAEHIIGLRVRPDSLSVSPKLPGYHHTARIGDHTLTVIVTGLGGGASLNGVPVSSHDNHVRLPLPLMNNVTLEFLE